MADPLGTYSSPQEQGWATVIPRSENDFWTAAARLALARRATPKATDSEDAKALRGFKPEEGYRFYSPALSKLYGDIQRKWTSRLSSGTFDNAEFMADTERYYTSVRNSMQLKTELENARELYEKNPFIKPDKAMSWLVGKTITDPTLEGLGQASRSNINTLGFLDEAKPSEVLDETTVWTQVTKDNLDKWFEQKVVEQGKFKAVALGLLAKDEQGRFVRRRPFTEYDAETGELKLSSVDKLIELGIVDMYKEQPYTAALIREKAGELARADGRRTVTIQDEAEVVRRQLAPRQEGRVEDIEGTVQGSYFVDRSAAGRSENVPAASRLWEKIKSVAVNGMMTGQPYLPGMDADTARDDPEFFGVKKNGIAIRSMYYDAREGRVMVVATEDVLDANGLFKEAKEYRVPLNANIIQNFYPAGVANELFKLAEEQGFMKGGNFSWALPQEKPKEGNLTYDKYTRQR